MVRQLRNNKVVLAVLSVLCAILAIVLGYVAVEIIREYGEWPSAAMFGVPALVLAVAAVVCVGRLLALRRSHK